MNKTQWNFTERLCIQIASGLTRNTQSSSTYESLDETRMLRWSGEFLTALTRDDFDAAHWLLLNSQMNGPILYRESVAKRLFYFDEFEYHNSLALIQMVINYLFLTAKQTPYLIGEYRLHQFFNLKFVSLQEVIETSTGLGSNSFISRSKVENGPVRIEVEKALRVMDINAPYYRNMENRYVSLYGSFVKAISTLEDLYLSGRVSCDL